MQIEYTGRTIALESGSRTKVLQSLSVGAHIEKEVQAIALNLLQRKNEDRLDLDMKEVVLQSYTYRAVGPCDLVFPCARPPAVHDQHQTGRGRQDCLSGSLETRLPGVRSYFSASDGGERRGHSIADEKSDICAG